MDMTETALIGIVVAAISAAVGWALARHVAKAAVTHAATRVEEALARVAHLEASLAAERQAYDQLRHTKQQIGLDPRKCSAEPAAGGRRTRKRDDRARQS